MEGLRIAAARLDALFRPRVTLDLRVFPRLSCDLVFLLAAIVGPPYC